MTGPDARSAGRILTTHTGSLPRPRDLVTMLREREEGRAPDEGLFQARVRAAVHAAVRKQAETGLSIIDDGEQGRADYTVYVKDRLTGFEGESAPLPSVDADEFPEWGALGPKALKGSPVTIHLYVDDADAFAKRAAAAGAKITMPVAEMFWGDRYGKLEDPFGHQWSVGTHVRDVSPEEMQRAMKEMEKKGKA